MIIGPHCRSAAPFGSLRPEAFLLDAAAAISAAAAEEGGGATASSAIARLLLPMVPRWRAAASAALSDDASAGLGSANGRLQEGLSAGRAVVGPGDGAIEGNADPDTRSLANGRLQAELYAGRGVPVSGLAALDDEAIAAALAAEARRFWAEYAALPPRDQRRLRGRVVALPLSAGLHWHQGSTPAPAWSDAATWNNHQNASTATTGSAAALGRPTYEVSDGSAAGRSPGQSTGSTRRATPRAEFYGPASGLDSESAPKAGGAWRAVRVAVEEGDSEGPQGGEGGRQEAAALRLQPVCSTSSSFCVMNPNGSRFCFH